MSPLLSSTGSGVRCANSSASSSAGSAVDDRASCPSNVFSTATATERNGVAEAVNSGSVGDGGGGGSGISPISVLSDFPLTRSWCDHPIATRLKQLDATTASSMVTNSNSLSTTEPGGTSDVAPCPPQAMTTQMSQQQSQQESQQRESDNVWARRRQVQGRERPTLALRKSSSNADAVTAVIARESPSLHTALSLDKPDSAKRHPRSAGGRPRGMAGKASQLARDAVAGEAATRRQERKRGEAEPANEIDGKQIDETLTSFELMRLPGFRGTKATDDSRSASGDATSNDSSAAGGFGSGNEEESSWEEGNRVGRSSLGSSHAAATASKYECIFPRDGSYARDEEYSGGEDGDERPGKTKLGNPSAWEVDDFPGFSMTPPGGAAAAATPVESESELDRDAPGGETEVVTEKCGWSRVAGRSSSVSVGADPAGTAASQKSMLLQRGSRSQRVCSATDVVMHPSPLPSSLTDAAESLKPELSSPASPTIDGTSWAELSSAWIPDGPTLEANLHKAGVAGEIVAQPPPPSAPATTSGFSSGENPGDAARTTASGLTAVGSASHARIH
ncbi:unnamed protein product, partial [Closterium sp. NIES-54]